MIERLLLVKYALSQVLQELQWDNLAIREWRMMDALKKLLHPFAQFTSFISGEDFTTISVVIPVIMDLNLHLEEVGQGLMQDFLLGGRIVCVICIYMRKRSY